MINGYKAYLMRILKQVANCKRDKKMPVEHGRLNIITVYCTSTFILFLISFLIVVYYLSYYFSLRKRLFSWTKKPAVLRFFENNQDFCSFTIRRWVKAKYKGDYF